MDFEPLKKKQCQPESANGNQTNHKKGNIFASLPPPAYSATGGIAPHLNRSIINISNMASEMGVWDNEIIAKAIRKDFKNISDTLSSVGFTAKANSSDQALVLQFKESLVASGENINVSRSKYMEKDGSVTEPMNEEEYGKHKYKKNVKQEIAVGKNVRSGIFGAIGYGAGGDIGSYAGAILDTGMGGVAKNNPEVKP